MMERIAFLFFFTLISIFFDIYFYQIVKKYNKIKWIKFLIPIYWSFTIITINNFFLYAFQFELGYYYKTITFNIIIGNFISKVLSLPTYLILCAVASNTSSTSSIQSASVNPPG